MSQTSPPVLSPPLLLATDGSASARLAQKMIYSIADLLHSEQTHSNVTLLAVVSVQPRTPKRVRRLGRKVTTISETSANSESPTSGETIAVVADDKPTPAMTEDQIIALLREDIPANFPLLLQIRQGRPAIEILNCARALQAGLIAVGHRGVGGVRELLLGSVSTAIARYAPCSVLVARAHPNESFQAGLRHVLLVVDQSVPVRQAIAIVQQLAPTGIEEITLLCIQSPLNAGYLVGPFVSPTPSWKLNQSLQDAQREQGEHVLQRAKAALNLPHVTFHTRLQTGDAGPIICQVAQEQGINLIVLGSDATRRSLLFPLQALRSQSRAQQPTKTPVLRNTRLSVTEDYVIHYAPCPVLLCRNDRVTG